MKKNFYVNFKIEENKYNIKPNDLHRMKVDYDKLNECFAEVLLSLMIIFKSINCSPDQIKDIYIKKNMENIFRQEFNYYF